MCGHTKRKITPETHFRVVEVALATKRSQQVQIGCGVREEEVHVILHRRELTIRRRIEADHPFRHVDVLIRSRAVHKRAGVLKCVVVHVVPELIHFRRSHRMVPMSSIIEDIDVMR